MVLEALTVTIASRPVFLAYAGGTKVGVTTQQAAKDWRSVSLRTRKMLAGPIVVRPNRHVTVASGKPEHSKPTTNRVRTRLISNCHYWQRREAVPTVGYRRRGPAICGGCKVREELQTRLIRGTDMYRN